MNSESIFSFLLLNRFVPEEPFFKSDKYFDFDIKSIDEFQTFPQNFPFPTPDAKNTKPIMIPNGSTNIINKTIPQISPKVIKSITQAAMMKSTDKPKPKKKEQQVEVPKVKVKKEEIGEGDETSYNGSEIDEQKEKELKLLKNRLSARKCRQKKKNYIKQLEEQVKTYKAELDNIKKESNKEKTIESYINILEEKEKEIEETSNKKKNDSSKIEFVANQKILLNYLFLYQIKVMMPLECRLFQNKFIKLAQFEDGDNVETIILKINNNIKMLNELYEFKKRDVHTSFSKGKESTAYKLYMFYENMKKYTELFMSNYSII